MPFKGLVEMPQGHVLTGWAVDEYGAPCEVAVHVGDRAPALVISDRPRTDLLEAGISTGQGGFYIDLEGMLAPGETQVALRLPDGTPLTNSPVTMSAQAREARPITYRGWIDTPQAGVIYGWALTGDGLPCTLQVDINGLEQFTVESDNPRPDLAKGGVSKGLGGYGVPLSGRLREGTNRVSIRFPNGDHLPGSPVIRVVGDAEAWHPEPEAAPPPPPPAPPPPPSPPSPPPAPEQVAHAEPSPARPAESSTIPAASSAPSGQEDEAVPVEAGQAPQPHNVAPFPAPPRKRPPLPSLAELDELSLDDLALAVAAGVISVPPPEHTPLPEPEQVPEPVPQESEDRHDLRPERPGFFARLFGRR